MKDNSLFNHRKYMKEYKKYNKQINAINRVIEMQKAILTDLEAEKETLYVKRANTGNN